MDMIQIHNYSGVDFCVSAMGVITSICNTRLMSTDVRFSEPEQYPRRGTDKLPLRFGRAYVVGEESEKSAEKIRRHVLMREPTE